MHGEMQHFSLFILLHKKVLMSCFSSSIVISSMILEISQVCKLWDVNGLVTGSYIYFGVPRFGL